MTDEIPLIPRATGVTWTLPWRGNGNLTLPLRAPTPREYIAGELSRTYRRQFLVIQDSYVVVVWIVLMVMLGICAQYLKTEPYNIPYFVWICCKLVALVLGYFCLDAYIEPYKAYHATVIVAGSILILVTFSISDNSSPCVALVMTTFILTLFDAMRFMYYYVMFRTYSAGGVRATESPRLGSRRLIYTLGAEITPGRNFPLGDNGEHCVICLEPYTVGTYVTVLDCSHYYHEGCVSKWIPRMRTCPICRCIV